MGVPTGTKALILNIREVIAEEVSLEHVAKIIEKDLVKVLGTSVKVGIEEGKITFFAEVNLTDSEVLQKLIDYFSGCPAPLRILIPEHKFEIVCC